MEGVELQNFIKVWLSVLICLCYCYGLRNIVPKGVKRLVLVLPVVCLFLYLPLHLSSVHLCGFSSFFIAWLANYKILLFAFGKGPLSSDPTISFPLFVAVSCLPIKIQQNPPQKQHPNGQIKENHRNGQIREDPSQKVHQNGKTRENPSPSPPSREGPLNYTIKGLLLAILVRVYDYSDHMHPTIIYILYAFHIYFLLEIILAVGAAMARSLLGLELEPQFNEPYLSTSLQDFWGRRWNLMVTSILRPTVYEPTLSFFRRLIGRQWAPLPAVFGTFVVSAIMHELMFYYLGRVKPTWEVTWFFLLHGFCVTVEIALKKVLEGRWRLPRIVSSILTVGFVMITGYWWFIPKFVACEVDVKALEEYADLGKFVRDVSQRLLRVLHING